MSDLSKYQKNETLKIHRSEIKLADYNPRKLSPEAKNKLRKNIKKRGMMGTLIWNERTGNLVSGHQRLSILDELEKGQDYFVEVTKVNLSDAEEKEQNVFMNNAGAQGEWDTILLGQMLSTPDLDLSMTGFSEADLNALDVEINLEELAKGTDAAQELLNTFENSFTVPKEEKPEKTGSQKEMSLTDDELEYNEESEHQEEDFDENDSDHPYERVLRKQEQGDEVSYAEKREAVKREKEFVKNYGNRVNSADFYLTIVFRDPEHKENFCEEYGIFAPDNLLVPEDFVNLIREKTDPASEENSEEELI